jgi:hypothetical protein
MWSSRSAACHPHFAQDAERPSVPRSRLDPSRDRLPAVGSALAPTDVGRARAFVRLLVSDLDRLRPEDVAAVVRAGGVGAGPRLRGEQFHRFTALRPASGCGQSGRPAPSRQCSGCRPSSPRPPRRRSSWSTQPRFDRRSSPTGPAAHRPRRSGPQQARRRTSQTPTALPTPVRDLSSRTGRLSHGADGRPAHRLYPDKLRTARVMRASGDYDVAGIARVSESAGRRSTAPWTCPRRTQGPPAA